MKISKLKQPYKKLAQFYTLETKKKERGLTLGNAFNWGTCVNFNYTKSHWKFWSDVEDGKSPKIPKSILSHFNKHNPKQAFTVMGMPKPAAVKKEKVTTTSTDDNQHFVGRKIRSFTFEPGINGIHYDSEIMDNLLGYHGTIIAAYPDAVQVSFETRKGTIIKFYPFGKDVKTSILGDSAESRLIPEEEVQKILDNMPEEPFKVGETVYLRGNGGQYKCVIDKIYFSGNCPISLDAGKRTVLQDVRIDGRRSPKGDVILSRTPWRNEKGFMLEIHNAKLVTPQGEEIINMELNPFELSELELSKAADVLETAGAIQVVEAVDLFASMLHKVYSHTSEITIADVDYHASLIKRKLSK